DSFLNGAKEITGINFSSGFNNGDKTPFFSPAYCGDTNTAEYVRAFCGFFDAFKRALDTVEKLFYKSGRKFNTQRFSGADNRLSGLQAGSFFVYLNRSCIIFKFNNFTDKACVSDSDN